MLGKVQCAETGGLRPENGTAPGAALTGKDAGVVLAGQFLVHAVEVANFTAANANITCRDILIRADTVPKLQHERLAETHDFVVGLTHGIEVRAALCATHRKGCEGVFEGLFKTQEL